jgi:hypothetical protein
MEGNCIYSGHIVFKLGKTSQVGCNKEAHEVTKEVKKLGTQHHSKEAHRTLE